MFNNLLYRLIWNTKTRQIILFLLQLLPINNRRILCVCWGGSKFNCNPKAITDALIGNNSSCAIHVVYAFHNPENFSCKLPDEIESVELGSLRYFYLLATSRFVIANTRITGINWPFPKRADQFYIQTQHGGHGIKKVELDVRDTLPDEYIQSAIEDTNRTDLMLSDSRYWTNVYRTAYQYKGEVLEFGLPRNDIFFSDDETKRGLKESMLTYFQIHKPGFDNVSNMKFLIYTPTFRSNGRKDVYGFDVDRVVEALEKRFEGKWFILVSSHPNMIGYYKEIYDFTHPRLIDVGNYPELQDLLVVCDALITDYSSAEMDFSLTRRPVFQLIRDREDYDRGTYIDPRSLPFPYAESDDELCERILSFNEDCYQLELQNYNKKIGLNQKENASIGVVRWMYAHGLK